MRRCPAGQVLLDHEGDLEGDGVVELPQVQAGELLDLLQPVDQGVAVDEELPGGLGDVQVVLEELVDGEEGLLVQGVDGVLLEDLHQEHLTQGSGELVDQPPDAQVLIVDDILLRVEDLAHLNGDLGLLVALGQLPQVQGHGADADDHPVFAPHPEGLLQQGGHPLDLLVVAALRQLVDQHHIAVPHVEDKVVLSVGKQALHHVQHGRVPALQLADDKHAPGYLRRHVELLGPHVDVAEQDIVGDDVFNKGGAVVLLLIVALGAVEGHAGHGAHGPADLVVAHGKHRVVETGTPAAQRPEGSPIQGQDGSLRAVDRLHIFRPLLADQPQVAAGDHGTLRVDNAYHPVGSLLDLQNRILKDPS